MAYSDIVVRGVSEAKRRSFRAYCVMNGYSITDAVKWLVGQVVDGKIHLPARKEKG